MSEIIMIYTILGASMFLNIMQVLFSNLTQIKYTKEQERMARTLAKYLLEEGDRNGRVKE